MPCYQVRTVSVEFSMKSIEHIKMAAEKLGWKVDQDMRDSNVLWLGGGVLSLNLKTSVAKFKSNEQWAFSKLKVAYSEAVVEDIAKKKRWLLKKKEGNKLELRRY